MIFKGLDTFDAAIWTERNDAAKKNQPTCLAEPTIPVGSTGDADLDAKYWWKVIGLGDDFGKDNEMWNDKGLFRVLEWGGLEA
jgi:hypothetical protein